MMRAEPPTNDAIFVDPGRRDAANRSCSPTCRAVKDTFGLRAIHDERPSDRICVVSLQHLMAFWSAHLVFGDI
jgi:hypothetical protein